MTLSYGKYGIFLIMGHAGYTDIISRMAFADGSRMPTSGFRLGSQSDVFLGVIPLRFNHRDPWGGRGRGGRGLYFPKGHIRS